MTHKKRLQLQPPIDPNLITSDIIAPEGHLILEKLPDNVMVDLNDYKTSFEDYGADPSNFQANNQAKKVKAGSSTQKLHLDQKMA